MERASALQSVDLGLLLLTSHSEDLKNGTDSFHSCRLVGKGQLGEKAGRVTGWVYGQDTERDINIFMRQTGLEVTPSTHRSDPV